MKYGILISFAHPNSNYSAWFKEKGCVKTFDQKHEAQKETAQLYFDLPAAHRKIVALYRNRASQGLKGSD